jgi:hypothetical protein
MLMWRMILMRSDFGLPIGTEHAYHPPKQPSPEAGEGEEPTAILHIASVLFGGGLWSVIC